MPLHATHQPTATLLWGLWRIEESEEELIQSIHFQIDTADLATISFPHRRVQWWAVRHLLGALVAHLAGRFGPLDPAQLTKDPNGRPHWPQQDCHVSLSHTRGWAAAALSLHAPVGIDIEEVTPKVGRVAPRIMVPEELAQAPDFEWLTFFWCAKEALYKMYGQPGLDFREQLRLHRHGDQLQGQVLDQGQVLTARCRCHRLPGHCLVLAGPG
ncbi:MAG: 4'-phosphopantetheinyl transferase superfamily protein [Bernardetiaceae bacterium]|jgi:phosphopantetheinyl transferase|nr:4'-phosphopantetheinyl transferase superfamily protein [Bernardetiaceae bacterium]